MPSTKTPTIEETLLKATKIKPVKKEIRSEYLTRIWDATCNLPDDKWDELPAPAYNWANDVTSAHNAWLQKRKANGAAGEFVPQDFPDVIADTIPTPSQCQNRRKSSRKTRTRRKRFR
jgi:hypothetical protein